MTLTEELVGITDDEFFCCYRYERACGRFYATAAEDVGREARARVALADAGFEFEGGA